MRHAKDFIPQMVEFKLSSVINGGSTATNVPVFPDSPAVGKNYVPSKLRKVMKRLEKGDIEEEVASEREDADEGD